MSSCLYGPTRFMRKRMLTESGLVMSREKSTFRIGWTNGFRVWKKIEGWSPYFRQQKVKRLRSIRLDSRMISNRSCRNMNNREQRQRHEYRYRFETARPGADAAVE